MLSQLVDIFNDSTWLMIFIVGWGSPLVAVLIAFFWRRRATEGDVARCILFYLLVSGVVLFARDTAPSALFGLGLCIVGPVLGAITIFRAAAVKLGDGEQPELRAFPILPLEQPLPEEEKQDP